MQCTTELSELSELSLQQKILNVQVSFQMQAAQTVSTFILDYVAKRRRPHVFCNENWRVFWPHIRKLSSQGTN